MGRKTDRGVSFSVLAGDGRVGVDVESLRDSLRDRIRDGSKPFDQLSDAERRFLLAELNDAARSEWSAREWHRLWTAALRAVRQRSANGLRRVLDLANPAPKRRGRPRIDRSALLEMSRSGATDAEIMEAFGINSAPRLRRMLNEAARSEAGR